MFTAIISLIGPIRVADDDQQRHCNQSDLLKVLCLCNSNNVLMYSKVTYVR
jgi:hypothetical protein